MIVTLGEVVCTWLSNQPAKFLFVKFKTTNKIMSVEVNAEFIEKCLLCHQDIQTDMLWRQLFSFWRHSKSIFFFCMIGTSFRMLAIMTLFVADEHFPGSEVLQHEILPGTLLPNTFPCFIVYSRAYKGLYFS